MLRRLLLSSSFAFFLALVLLAFAPSDGFFVRPVAATTTVSDDEGGTSTKQYQQVQDSTEVGAVSMNTIKEGGGAGGGVVSEEVLVGWARRLVNHDMGLKDEDLLDDSFYFIGPFDGPVGKRPFVDGSKTFDLRGAFPDFKFNEHDFRVDEVQPMRVWLTTRKTGTHLGDLPMYGKLIKPTGRQLNSPPETYSATFNEEGRCTKLTGGFVMDARQGTSGGLGGPLGIAKAVGHPRPIFSHEPPVAAAKELLARLLRAGEDRAPHLPPSQPPGNIPQSELKALAVRVLLEEDLGRRNPDRLATNFQFFDPLLGGLSRGRYLSWYLPAHDLHAAFPDLQVLAYNVRVEEGGWDPATVWLTVRYKGTHTGAPIGAAPFRVPGSTGLRYESGPEAVSMTFNDQGQITRLTVGAVMDREEGNTGGLGGLHGVKYALGRPSSPLLTRPFRFHTKAEWKQATLAAMPLPLFKSARKGGKQDDKHGKAAEQEHKEEKEEEPQQEEQAVEMQ